MLKKFIHQLTISVFITSATVSIAHAGNSCMPIGGVAIPTFFAEGKGKPIIISAALTGSVNNAAGKITAQRETSTGLEMDMEHYFGRDDGGAFQTKDLGILTRVVGRENQFMIEITYEIQPESTSGELAGYTGQFTSYGHVDLTALQGLIRYNGEICK